MTVNHADLLRSVQLKHRIRTLVRGVTGNDFAVLGAVFSVGLRSDVTIANVDSDQCCLFTEAGDVYYNDDRGVQPVEFPGIAAPLFELYGYVSMWAGFGIIPVTGRLEFFGQGVNEDLEEWVFQTCPHFAR